MTCWPGDGGPYITLPAVFTTDPRSGTRNVGMYRVQVFDATTTAMHWQIHKDGAADWRGMGERMDVAIVLGLDPITTYTASAPLPKHIDELMFAGFPARPSRSSSCKCKTVDLEVPARAEIVIEGYVAKGELRDEGPFGDHTGYYSPPEPFPVVHVTAITMRRDAIYPTIIVGVPPQEDSWLGKATERLFLPALRMTLPEIVDYDLPIAGRSTTGDRRDPQGLPRPRAEGDARDLGHRPDVAHEEHRGRGCRRRRARLRAGDVAGGRERRSRRATCSSPRARSTCSTTPPTLQFTGGKIGIDATAKGPAEGYARGWPEQIRMSEDVRDRVTSRWAEYGIAGVAPADGRGRG